MTNDDYRRRVYHTAMSAHVQMRCIEIHIGDCHFGEPWALYMSRRPMSNSNATYGPFATAYFPVEGDQTRWWNYVRGKLDAGLPTVERPWIAGRSH